MKTRPLLVLSLEGLATSALGCYGSSWNETPSIDQLAANGCLWDSWICSEDDPRQLIKQVQQSETPWLNSWKQRGHTEFITDVGELATAAESFDSVVHLETDWHPSTRQDSEPASEIEQTHLAAVIAQAIGRDAQTDGNWSLMWIHSAVLGQCWDAPRSLMPIDDIEMQDEEPWDDELGPIASWDENEKPVLEESIPLIMEDVAVPSIRVSPMNSRQRQTTSPYAQGQQDEGDQHPDTVTSWMRTYGCQVRLLDLMIEILSQSLICQDCRIMILGTSGMSLGQNGWIGHQVGPLRSQDIRLPMIISDVGPIRMPALTSDQKLGEILQGLATENTSWASPAAWADENQVSAVHTASQRAQQATTTPQWFYTRDEDGQDHLFLKPDDLEDFNDVSRLRRDIVMELDLSDTP